MQTVQNHARACNRHARQLDGVREIRAGIGGEIMSNHQVIVPTWAHWITPREAHSDERPFCQHETCLCHFDGEHMERHFVAPVASGKLSIGEALAKYHGRVLVESEVR
jgi:hypothetical protein